jgi:hypothetical protein
VPTAAQCFGMSDAGLDDALNAGISFIANMHKLQISHYTSIAAFILWLWDFLITLDKEVEYVWQQEGRLINTLYFLVSLQVDIQ